MDIYIYIGISANSFKLLHIACKQLHMVSNSCRQLQIDANNCKQLSRPNEIQFGYGESSPHIAHTCNNKRATIVKHVTHPGPGEASSLCVEVQRFRREEEEEWQEQETVVSSSRLSILELGGRKNQLSAIVAFNIIVLPCCCLDASFLLDPMR